MPESDHPLRLVFLIWLRDNKKGIAGAIRPGMQVLQLYVVLRKG